MKPSVHRTSPSAQSALRARWSAAILATGLAITLPAAAWADQHTAGTPQLSSNPGAAYTIYLDFAGFNYTGMWADGTPGSTPAYADVAANGTFNAQQIADIKATWAAVARQYAAFNINVTTVDPATGANAATDQARQTFYANKPNMMHTIIGSTVRNNGTTQWTGAAGVSFTGTTTGNETDSGGHTNWIASEGLGYSEVGHTSYIAQGATHENGHGLGLGHQSDFIGTTLVTDYGIGDNDANGSLTGPGSYGSIMGDGNFAQRVTWRLGSTSNGGTGVSQNDVGQMIALSSAASAANQGRTGGADLHLINDGIGRSMAAATVLPLNGKNVNFNLAKGVILPLSESNPQPVGAANYTKDYFSFNSDGATSITLVARNGTEFVTPGVADANPTLRSTLKIYNASQALVGTATEDASTLFETYTGVLPAGKYYAEIASAGGHQQVNDPARNPQYNAAYLFDMGAFFLTGSGFAVPAVKPVITSPLTAGATVGTAFSYQIAASNAPTSFGASGLPDGLTVSTATGLISGKATAGGSYSVTIAAFNSAGAGSATLKLTVTGGKPVINSVLSAPSRKGVAFLYQITATNSPTSFSASGLPAGLIVSKSTGKITGRPTVFGGFSVLIGATNSAGTGTATLNLVVKAEVPVITSATSASATVGTAFTYSIVASNSPTSYGASGLPSGLTINQTTGVISGTPTKSGTFNVTIAAFNSGGSNSTHINLTVAAATVPALAMK